MYFLLYFGGRGKDFGSVCGLVYVLKRSFKTESYFLYIYSPCLKYSTKDIQVSIIFLINKPVFVYELADSQNLLDLRIVVPLRRKVVRNKSVCVVLDRLVS